MSQHRYVVFCNRSEQKLAAHVLRTFTNLSNVNYLLVVREDCHLLVKERKRDSNVEVLSRRKMSYLIWVLWHNLFSILSLLFKTHMVDLDATQLHPVLLLMVQDMMVLSLLGPLQLFLDTGHRVGFFKQTLL